MLELCSLVLCCSADSLMEYSSSDVLPVLAEFDPSKQKVLHLVFLFPIDCARSQARQHGNIDAVHLEAD